MMNFFPDCTAVLPVGLSGGGGGPKSGHYHFAKAHLRQVPLRRRAVGSSVRRATGMGRAGGPEQKALYVQRLQGLPAAYQGQPSAG